MQVRALLVLAGDGAEIAEQGALLDGGVLADLERVGIQAAVTGDHAVAVVDGQHRAVEHVLCDLGDRAAGDGAYRRPFFAAEVDAGMGAAQV